MTSYYAGPTRPRLLLGAWPDLVAAVQAGVTAETQWCELKLDVPAEAQAANTELAKDLASLAIDGGLLLIGVRDKASKESDVVGVEDSALAGLESRSQGLAHGRAGGATKLRAASAAGGRQGLAGWLPSPGLGWNGGRHRRAGGWLRQKMLRNPRHLSLRFTLTVNRSARWRYFAAVIGKGLRFR